MRYPNKKVIAILISLAILVYIAVLNMDIKSEYPGLPATVDFNFHVKPILVQKCYLCHGPDPSSRKGGLRLDTEEGATQLLKSGNYAINREHPDISALMTRIEHKDPDMQMPPPDSKMLLTEKEIAVIRKWIEQGADWKPHWAFIRPDSNIYNRLSTAKENPIDVLVNEQLTQNELKPAAEADQHSLIRRAAYLLTGLPPTVAAVEKFVSDKSPDAYEKMIDRYLQSPAFGERWARHWMDLTRYAETRGHEFDFNIAGTWRYRDYLVRSFNDDIGYDQLLKEQLAGDLLQQPRRNPVTGANESHLGTVFLAMTEGVQGPVDIRKDEADRIDNMIDVTSKTFQSLTVSCSRCHDHKFDPIPTTDYYALYGVMESTRFSPVAANTSLAEEENTGKRESAQQQQRAAIAAAWLSEKNIRETAGDGIVPSASPVASTALQEKRIGDFSKNDFGSWTTNGLAFGHSPTTGNPVWDTVTHTLLSLDAGKASSRSNGLGVFGVLRSPNFTIEDDFIVVRATGKESTIRVVINNFQLISDPIYGGLSKWVNNNQWEDFVIDLSSWKGHNAYIEIMPGHFEAHAYRLPADAFVEVKYVVSFNDKMPTEPKASAASGHNNLAQAIQRWQTGLGSSEDIQLLNENIRTGRLQKRFPAIDLHNTATGIGLANHPRADHDFYSAVYDGNGINSPVFIRGDHQQVSPQRVPRRFFTVLSKSEAVFQSAGSGRLELAESMLSPDNSLTARVMVNRIWHHLFGRGIVETVDNFGLQGKLPTHPALLDYLAIRFQKDNWSVKKMIKLIVTSNAFRRSTEASADMLKKDPANLYLARFPLLRLEAEAIRDGMLLVSGSLDTTMYGPPVPVHLTSFMNGRGKPEKSGPIDGAGRRSIYQEVRRNFLDPMMLAFDRPIPFSTFGNRNVTNVPAQSLFFMNDPFVVQQAERMATSLLQARTKTADRIQLAYETLFSRPATDEEVKGAEDFLQALASHYTKQEPVLIWKDYCHSLFNLKEFIFLI